MWNLLIMSFHYLERDDPKVAFPAARLVGFYRRLWESCVPKHIDVRKIDQSNEILKEAGTHLRKERDGLQLHHDKQLARLRFFEQALESSRERLISLLDDWNYPLRPNLTGLRDVAKRRVRIYLFRVALSYLGDIEILQPAKQCRENCRIESSYILSDSL
ncbi:hypothetical protein PCH_Pc17g01270 [Penicillium rubens Wisconsin 54-1255]|uniref:Uncharacterized protein n=1 Tax=Penicillium rubens (strain ATCC 28089 / DSM 1075 / NRRL 1951 / Wisconsin 54-1255) TaxID=500485 RepID=B6HB45_PENRW|nr:hypothetical protein PCH_Pc17g01270 [Penicillium rubens Wisconsin 54-1255]